MVEVQHSLKIQIKILTSEIKNKEVEIHTKISLKSNLDPPKEVQILASIQEVKIAKVQ